MSGLIGEVSVRVMLPDEFGAVHDLAIASFGDHPKIGRVLDLLHTSRAWVDELSFVAARFAG